MYLWNWPFSLESIFTGSLVIYCALLHILWSVFQRPNDPTWILKAADGFVASADVNLWNGGCSCVCGISVEYISLQKKKKRKKKFSSDHFKNIFNDGTHIFLFAFLEEGFFPMFVLGANKVLLKSKTKEQTYE